MSSKVSKEYCGCCGRACSGDWCKRCAKHVDPKKTLWDATVLASDGWLLRSGAADGADHAFEVGCDIAHGDKEIWLPWKGFNGSKSQFILFSRGTPELQRAFDIAASVHPAWHHCNGAAQRLHARNVLQVLGADFNTPADRVICWTPNGAVIGGTATALRLAHQYDIEVINLYEVPARTLAVQVSKP